MSVVIRYFFVYRQNLLDVKHARYGAGTSNGLSGLISVKLNDEKLACPDKTLSFKLVKMACTNKTLLNEFRTFFISK